MNSDNEITSKYHWNHRVSPTSGSASNGKGKDNHTKKNKKYHSLHGVQTFHRRQHLKPSNAANNTNRRNSFTNIRRASRSSEKDLVSVLEQMLGDKCNNTPEAIECNRSTNDTTNHNTKSECRYNMLIRTNLF